MCIQIEVSSKDEVRVRKLGARWLPEENIWIIPDSVQNLNPFRKWLPDEEGFIVQRPFFVARAKRGCLSCGKETPLVALGAKCCHSLAYMAAGKKPVWEKYDFPIFFTEISYLEEEVIESLKEYYPFFQLREVEECDEKLWVNTCIHCNAVQDDMYNFMDGDAPLSPVSDEKLAELRIIYFKLKFDYFIISGCHMSPRYEEII